jgi:hypothetical protein
MLKGIVADCMTVVAHGKLAGAVLGGISAASVAG